MSVLPIHAFQEELFPANSKEEVEIDAGIESVYQEVNTEEEIGKVNLLFLHLQLI